MKLIEMCYEDEYDDEIEDEFNEKRYWGMQTFINIYNADLALMQDPEHIEKYITDLCDLIRMNPHGKPTIERFGKGQLYGYSFTQLIETSCITGHFSEVDHKIYIDIFSCQSFEPKIAAYFSMDYFAGKNVEYRTVFRD